MLGIAKGVCLQLMSGSEYQKRMEETSPVTYIFKSGSVFDFGSVMDEEEPPFT